MQCRRCGERDVSKEDLSRLSWFEGVKPTNEEMKDFWSGAGLFLCPDCRSSYLEWLKGEHEDAPPSFEGEEITKPHS